MSSITKFKLDWQAMIRYSFRKRTLLFSVQVKAEDVTTRVENLVEDLRLARNEISNLREKTAVFKASSIANKAFVVGTSKKIR